MLQKANFGLEKSPTDQSETSKAPRHHFREKNHQPENTYCSPRNAKDCVHKVRRFASRNGVMKSELCDPQLSTVSWFGWYHLHPYKASSFGPKTFDQSCRTLNQTLSDFRSDFGPRHWRALFAPKSQRATASGGTEEGASLSAGKSVEWGPANCGFGTAKAPSIRAPGLLAAGCLLPPCP